MRRYRYCISILGLFFILFISACSLFRTTELKVNITSWNQDSTSVSFDYELIGDTSDLSFVFYNEEDIIKNDKVTCHSGINQYSTKLLPAQSRTYILKIGYVIKVEGNIETLDLLYEKEFTLPVDKPLISITFDTVFRFDSFDRDTFLLHLMDNIVITDVLDGVIEVTESMINIDDVIFNQAGFYKIIISCENSYSVITEEIIEIEFSADVDAPTITLKDELILNIGSTALDLIKYFEVVDNHDGNLILTIDNIDCSLVNFNQVGQYNLVITIEDASGNEVKKIFLITIEDHKKPKIANIKELEFEVKTSLPNLKDYFLITDDSEIISVIIDVSAINMDKIGSYLLNVSATDIFGNKELSEFSVRVVDSTSPVIEILDNLDINLGDSVPDLTKYIKVTDNYYSITVKQENFDTSEVDLSKGGTYPIYITIFDGSNNVAYLTIYINIYVDENYEEVVPTERIEKLFKSSMPSIGDAKVLVIPIGFSAYPKTDTMLEMIKIGFFGNETQTGWESLRTYYLESSYGKLNISGTVTPWYTPLRSQSQYALYEDTTNYKYGSTLLLYEALTYFKDYYDYRDYDANNDGYIDAVYLIYNCPIGGNGTPVEESFYWAYVYWDYLQDRNYGNGMDAFSYMFAGYSFFFRNMRSGESIYLNSETIIHETGHMLGLDDYYDYYDGKGVDGGYGGADMMDYNIGDHNPFSKALLGWTNPLVVNKSGMIDLTSFTETGMFLLIPVGTYNGLYSEYFLIDFFTLTGLNSFGMGDFLKASKDAIAMGVRITHVNAVLTDMGLGYEFKYSSSNDTNKYKIIRWLEADYNNIRLDCDSNSNTVEYDDFFTPASKQFGYDNFTSYSTYSNQSLPFKMQVLYMDNYIIKIDIKLN